MVEPNPLYPDSTDSFDTRWSGLPVDAPRFNYTPNSSLIESEPRKAEPFKLVPVQGDPFERSAERLRAPYKHVNDVPEGKIPYRSNLPLIVDKFMNTAVSGATAARDAYTGKMQMTDPETGMPTDEAIRRSIDMASLGGPGGMGNVEKGAVIGSGPVRTEPFKFTPVESTAVSDAFKSRFNQEYLPNGVPKPEAFDRVLPAVRNTETGKISTTKRGDEHASILDKLWAKQGGDPGVSTMELYQNMLPKHEMGFYDPKNKHFWPREHPDWRNIDSPDLTPRQAMKSGQTFYEDTSKPAQVLSALRNNEGYKVWDAAANEAGFTTDAYHGATRPTSAFANAKVNKPEFYSASDPKLAEDYATMGLSHVAMNKFPADRNFSPQILPLKLNTSNYHIVDAKGKSWDQINENAIKEAKELGKSGVTVHNVKDPISETSPFQEPSTIHIALDPSTVRSRFAKFNPEDIKKNGLLLSDTQKPGMAMAALHDAPTFYSAVEHAVNNIKQQKMPADQWLGTLNNAKGVKPEEMDWLGLREHLQSKGKEPVTKQEVQDFVNQNKVELKEVNKGYSHESELKGRQLAESHGHNWDDVSPVDRRRYIQTANEARLTEDIGGTKYSKYQLPGGENYREKLLTLPNQAKLNWKQNGDTLEASNGYKVVKEGENYITINPEGKRVSATADLDQAKFNLESSHENKHLPDQYKSSHWDEPNVLAHVRMNDRNIEGKKSLHIEEIQSDWHQAGRDKGYAHQRTDADIDKQLAEFAARFKITKPDELARARQSIIDQGVPNAPFKKTWHELVLKRMIREAAEKGYDRISWTPGEAQAARYDLSKQVDTIQATKNKDGTFDVRYRPLNDAGFHEMGKGITEQKLSESVGKELAEKIVKQEKETQSYKGLDLKVGGEGMKAWYGTVEGSPTKGITGQTFEKIGKEHGVKVKQAETGKNPNYELENLGGKWRVLNKLTSERKSYNSKSEAEAALPKNPVHYIDIPESLKNVAMKKGFSLFSGGFMFSPVAGNPHENNK